jgi:hypothetical protein
MFTSVLERYATSIFRVEGQATQAESSACFTHFSTQKMEVLEE